MKVTVNYNTINDMKVEIKKPLSDKIIHVTGAFIDGFAEAWVKYATNNAIVSDDVLCSSIGASNVREALKIGLLERFVEQGCEVGSEAYDFAVECLDNDMSWYSSIFQARGYDSDEAFEKACLKGLGRVVRV